MNKQQNTPGQERRLKLAEAGILFVIILGVAIFAGVRWASRDIELVEPQAVTIVEPEPAPAEVVVTERTVVEALPGAEGETAAPTAGADTESLAAAEAATEQAIPAVVTYHPAYLLRSPQEKAKAWLDLQLLARTLRHRDL